MGTTTVFQRYLSVHLPSDVTHVKLRISIYLILEFFNITGVRGVLHRNPLRYDVYEEQPEGAFIGNVKEDSGLAIKYFRNHEILSQLRFSLRHPNALFTVDDLTGEIHAESTIDREKICPYALSCQQTLDVTVRPLAYFQVEYIV